VVDYLVYIFEEVGCWCGVVDRFYYDCGELVVLFCDDLFEVFEVVVLEWDGGGLKLVWDVERF